MQGSILLHNSTIGVNADYKKQLKFVSDSVDIQCPAKRAVCGVVWASDGDTSGDNSRTVHETGFLLLLITR